MCRREVLVMVFVSGVQIPVGLMLIIELFNILDSIYMFAVFWNSGTYFHVFLVMHESTVWDYFHDSCKESKFIC